MTLSLAASVESFPEYELICSCLSAKYAVDMMSVIVLKSIFDIQMIRVLCLVQINT